jgi:hypothetical protein
MEIEHAMCLRFLCSFGLACLLRFKFRSFEPSFAVIDLQSATFSVPHVGRCQITWGLDAGFGILSASQCFRMRNRIAVAANQIFKSNEFNLPVYMVDPRLDILELFFTTYFKEWVISSREAGSNESSMACNGF